MAEILKTALLIIPPLYDFYFTAHRWSCIGATIVRELLEKEGVKVTYLNFPLMQKKSAPLPGSLMHLRGHLLNESGKASFFTHYYRFGPATDECVSIMDQYQFDYVFISLFAFCYSEPMIELIDAIRVRHKNALIIAGGAGVTVNPQFFLENSSVDYLLTGEAETNLSLFLRCLLANSFVSGRIPGLFSNNKTMEPSGPLVMTDDTSVVTTVVPRTFGRTTRIDLSLSRGCLKKCKFCSNHLSHGRDLRIVPLDSVKTIFQKIAPEQGELIINFEDDNLLYRKEYFLELVRFLKNRFPSASFMAENGLDYTLIDSCLCEELIDLGFKQFNFSLGTGDSKIAAYENRTLKLEQYENLLQISRHRAIPVITYFICGLSNDTKESTAKNLAYLASLPTNIGISMFYPVPGLENFSERSLFKYGEIVRCCGSSAWPWNGSLSTTTMITAFKIARYLNLKKIAFHNGTDQQLIDRIEKNRSLYTIINGAGGKKKIDPVPVQDKELVELFFQECERKYQNG